MDDRAHADAADGSSADVVPLRRRPDELVDDRYLLDALLENTPDHVYFKDSQSRFVRISRALGAWLGLSDAAEAIGHTDFDFFGEAHAQKTFADEQRLMRTGEALVGIEEPESWADGRCTWVSTTKVPLRDRDGAVIGLFGISRDITERKQAEQRVQEQTSQLAEQAQKLERLASLDDLTGLYNRRALATVGEHVLYEARRSGNPLGVLFIDLDGLKAINDGHTHRAGDDALRAVAGILREASREADVVARIGGDEFCILAANAGAETVQALAERIDRAVQEHNDKAGIPYAVSVSIGSVLVDPRSPGSVEDVIQRADAAMYDRKARRIS